MSDVCSSLTGYGSSEPFGLVVEQSLPELCLAAARRTNQRNGPLSVGRLVVQRHLLIGENLFIVHIWASEKGEVNEKVGLSFEGKKVRGEVKGRE